jgi:hypothetical protein
MAILPAVIAMTSVGKSLFIRFRSRTVTRCMTRFPAIETRELTTSTSSTTATSTTASTTAKTSDHWCLQYQRFVFFTAPTVPHKMTFSLLTLFSTMKTRSIKSILAIVVGRIVTAVFLSKITLRSFVVVHFTYSTVVLVFV